MPVVGMSALVGEGSGVERLLPEVMTAFGAWSKRWVVGRRGEVRGKNERSKRCRGEPRPPPLCPFRPSPAQGDHGAADLLPSATPSPPAG